MIKKILAVSVMALMVCKTSYAAEITEEPTTEISDTDTTQMTLGEFKETISEESELYGSLSYSQVFDLMKESINAGESISLTDAFALSGGLTVPDNMMYDLSESGLTGSLDPSAINIQYGNLISKMDEDYMASDLSAQSQGAVNLFNHSYGDLSGQMVLTQAQLPDGWSMPEMVSSNNDIINRTYQDAYSDGNYESVRNSIDVSGIFSQASKGAIAYNLTSNSDMHAQLDSISAKYKNEAQAKKNASIAESEALMASNFASMAETKNLVDSFYVDENGKLVTPYDSEISEQFNNKLTENMQETVEEHPFASSMFDYTLDGYASKVDGDSSALAQLTSGYIFQENWDVLTGNSVADSGDDLNWMEYIATGQIGEDIYDLFHPSEKKDAKFIDPVKDMLLNSSNIKNKIN